MKPNFFIVGEPKCATTALHQYLAQNPDIYMSEDKEPNYFATDLGSNRFYKNEKDYLKLFKDANHKIVGESSTNYLNSQKAAKNIYEFNPEAKILAIFREPVSFLQAYHSRQLFLINQPENDLIKAIDNCGEMENTDSLNYLERINYTEHIKRYFKYFPNKNLKIMFFEDFLKDNRKFYQEILDFLEVDKQIIPNFKDVNSNKIVRFKIIKRIAESDLIWPVARKVFPKQIYNLIKKTIHKITSKEVVRSEIDEYTKLKLRKLVSKNVHDLENVLKKYQKLDRNLREFWGY